MTAIDLLVSVAINGFCTILIVGIYDAFRREKDGQVKKLARKLGYVWKEEANWKKGGKE